MKAAWDIVKQKYNWIATCGCAAHILNLLVKDILELPGVNTLIKKVKKIVKMFKYQYVPHALLNRFQIINNGQTQTLKMPAPTRWGSHHFCLQGLIENKISLQKAIKEFKPDTAKQNAKKNLIQEMLFDESLWDEIDLLNLILKITSVATGVIQGDRTSISKIIPIFSKITADITVQVPDCSLKTSALQLVKKRFESLCNDHVTVACLLDPSNNLNGIDETYLATLARFIYARFPQDRPRAVACFQIAAQMIAKTGVCSPEKSFWLGGPPSDGLLWWQTYGNFISQDLKEIAVQLLSIPASSASAERNWSSYGFVHSKTRNRLTTKNAEMLTFLYDNSKSKKQKDPE
jgi:hypothetical protein